MYPVRRKLFTLSPIVCFAILLSGCGGGSSSTGGGSGGQGGSTYAARGDGDSAGQIQGPADVPRAGRGDFSLVFEQSYQSCSSCGIWFDSADLVIEHSMGTYTASQVGSLLIKQAPFHQGFFRAGTSAIPRNADIISATLYMHLNPHEGISNDDYTSTLAVHGQVNGNLQFVREITAQYDIRGAGFSKANPVVPIDFTEYARQL